MPDEFEKWRDRHFKERVERVGEHFANTPERRVAYDAFLQHLTPVRELRNHMAHGYFQMVIRPRSEELVVGITQAKNLSESSSPETKHLSFAELRKALALLSAATDEFQRLTDKDAGWKP